MFVCTKSLSKLNVILLASFCQYKAFKLINTLVSINLLTSTALGAHRTKYVRSSLKAQLTYVSSYHLAIRYTFNSTQESISILDINCKVQNEKKNNLSFFYKPHGCTLLLKSVLSSCHPKNAIPKSQFLRHGHICSGDQYFKLDEIFFFAKKGYVTFRI